MAVGVLITDEEIAFGVIEVGVGEGFEFLVIGMGVERLIEGEEALTGEAKGVERREGGVGDGVGGRRSLRTLVSPQLSLSDD